MAGIFGSGSSSGGQGLFGKTSGGGGGGGALSGIGHFVENLGKDVKDATLGLPSGIEQLVAHPIRSAETMGKATWQDWSPLFHGHVGEFAHNLYNHPLAPLLDIATVFTGGASVAGRLGVKLGELGVIAPDSALARLGSMPKDMLIHDPMAKGFKPTVTTDGGRLHVDLQPHAPTGTSTSTALAIPGDEELRLKVPKAQAGESPRPALRKVLPQNPIYNKLYRKAYEVTSAPNTHIPAWFTDNVFGPKANYARLHIVDHAKANLATNVAIGAALKAGKALSEKGTLPDLAHGLFKYNYAKAIAHAPEVTLEQVQKHGLPEGYVLWKSPEHAAASDAFHEASKPSNISEFETQLRNWGSKITTSDPEKAFVEHRSGTDYVKLARKDVLDRTNEEGARSARFLHTLYKAPTKVWKAALLGYSPRVVINNGVGNWLMYAMRQGGSHAARGFIDAVRYSKGERAAYNMLKDTGDLRSFLGKQHFLNTHFADEIHGNSFMQATFDEAGKDSSGLKSGPFYKLVHSLADQPVKAASISAYLRGAPEVRALQRQGMSFEDAARTALNKDAGLRDRAAMHARVVAGDYTTTSKAERAMRDIMPFYLWDKHIARHALNMLATKPGRVLFAAQLGKQGAAATQNALGAIPDYMLSMIPIGHSGSRTTLLSTQGMNPYSTVSDLIDVARGLSTGGSGLGSTIGGEFNPVIGHAIEQITGKTLTGANAKSHGGMIPSILYDTATSLPAIGALQTALGHGRSDVTSKGQPTLYQHSLKELISSLGGITMKEADLNAAHAAAAKQTGASTKKKHGLFG